MGLSPTTLLWTALLLLALLTWMYCDLGGRDRA